MVSGRSDAREALIKRFFVSCILHAQGHHGARIKLNTEGVIVLI